MTLTALALVACARQQPPPTFQAAVGEQRDSYRQLAHLSLQQLGDSLQQLQGSIVLLLQSPSTESLSRARAQWIRSRRYWNIAEAFNLAPSRGFEPTVAIDKMQFWASTRIDAWPLNPDLMLKIIADNGEARIYSLTIDNIEALNNSEGEGSFTLGFHAIEYLLWGDPKTGTSDEEILATLAVDSDTAIRRRNYLSLITAQLVADHGYLHDIWNGARGSYANRMATVSNAEATTQSLLGLLHLVEQEMIYRTVQVPMRTASPRLAQSYFSAQTGQDLLSNLEGVETVMLGKFESYEGVGLLSLITAVDREIGYRLGRELKLARRALTRLSNSFDNTIDAPVGDNNRALVSAAIGTLQALQRSLNTAAVAMRLDISEQTVAR